MRKGFGLLQALMIIILISGIMTIAMKYASISAKQTGDIYVRESGELFMNSAVELSLLAISGYERNNSTGCLSEINITSPDKRFTADVNITDYYLLEDSDDYKICDDNKIGKYNVNSIQTEDSHGMVMLNIVVETNNTNPRNKNKHLRLVRRTLQRP